MPRSRIQRYGDPLIALLFVATATAEIATDGDLSAAERIGAAAVALAVTVALLQRRRAPLLLAALVPASMLLRTVVPVAGDGVAYGIPAIIAAYNSGAELEGRKLLAGAALTAATVVYLAIDGGGDFGSFLFYGLLFAFTWTMARLARVGRQREGLLADRARLLELQRDEQARAAVEDERRRIARELHDVVAHAISVVVLQARGGRRLLDSEPAASREAFDTIERTSTLALSEMRRLLGLLRAEDEASHAPQPTLADIGALADELRAAGMPVELAIEGEPAPLPPGVDVSAYRIVQEALTNALKHAGPARARVRVAYEPDAVLVEVIDDGAGGATDGAMPRELVTGGGHGLVGIRERVALVGGEVSTGPRAAGGYAVSARLPYAAER